MKLTTSLAGGICTTHKVENCSNALVFDTQAMDTRPFEDFELMGVAGVTDVLTLAHDPMRMSTADVLVDHFYKLVYGEVRRGAENGVNVNVGLGVHPVVVAIGEIGLETCSDVEERVFRAQLGIDYYPKVIHTPRRAKREVLERIIAIVDDVGAKDAALASEIDKVMLISTDKAVNPRNVIGATKLLAERLTISANYYKGSKKTAFSCVRFGNVLNSSGSVVPLFAKQMRGRRCITITDTSMTRFVTSISQAVDLKLQATMRMRGGEIFVLKMLAVNITDLARAVIAELGPSCMAAPEDVVIKCVGKRPGEKIHEELEMRRALT